VPELAHEPVTHDERVAGVLVQSFEAERFERGLHFSLCVDTLSRREAHQKLSRLARDHRADAHAPAMERHLDDAARFTPREDVRLAGV
jgi:hypothetical protein